jgi:ParB family chromosome partitioning protein
MSDNLGKKKALGRGLGALLATTAEKEEVNVPGDAGPGTLRFVRIEYIEANPFQPRARFSQAELNELAESIRQHGVIQPITIRKTEVNKYQLISGERRLRASQLAGLTEIPAFIRTANDEQMLELALVENIQREDLNPLEIALTYQRLIEECQISQEELSQRVGKDRSTVSNYIRLLKLPHEVQVAIRDRLISMGHARALINLDDVKAQLVILSSILEKKASVRQVEEMVRNYSKEPSDQPESTRNESPKPVIQSEFESERISLNGILQTGVDIKVNAKGAGKIIISFKSSSDLQRIIAKIES